MPDGYLRVNNGTAQDPVRCLCMREFDSIITTLSIAQSKSNVCASNVRHCMNRETKGRPNFQKTIDRHSHRTMELIIAGFCSK